ncbi:CreA family protein [Psychromonas sp. SP041]|uniref:CreA family protein n=1 Tax=Psychromonas sp. SP041 TaxID=1365007 RepID=UPI0003F9EDF2|nr:CreA family protein [Psychromonas sp. SP041]
MLKKLKMVGIILLILIISFFVLKGCSDDEVGDVSLGLFTTQDIKLNTLKDPIVTGVTCHVASIEADLSFSDPSDSAISCRQTGPITSAMIAEIDKSKSGDVVFKKSKSIFFKTMKIRRVYDPENQTLMYVSYSTKETSGSFKHSLSTVPLWKTDAYQSSTKVPSETTKEIASELTIEK